MLANPALPIPSGYGPLADATNITVVDSALALGGPGRGLSSGAPSDGAARAGEPVRVRGACRGHERADLDGIATGLAASGGEGGNGSAAWIQAAERIGYARSEADPLPSRTSWTAAPRSARSGDPSYSEREGEQISPWLKSPTPSAFVRTASGFWLSIEGEAARLNGSRRQTPPHSIAWIQPAGDSGRESAVTRPRCGERRALAR